MALGFLVDWFVFKLAVICNLITQVARVEVILMYDASKARGTIRIAMPHIFAALGVGAKRPLELNALSGDVIHGGIRQGKIDQTFASRGVRRSVLGKGCDFMDLTLLWFFKLVFGVSASKTRAVIFAADICDEQLRIVDPQHDRSNYSSVRAALIRA
jgi:hypothetical protein